jgi:hypothetical protein
VSSNARGPRFNKTCFDSDGRGRIFPPFGQAARPASLKTRTTQMNYGRQFWSTLHGWRGTASRPVWHAGRLRRARSYRCRWHNLRTEGRQRFKPDAVAMGRPALQFAWTVISGVVTKQGMLTPRATCLGIGIKRALSANRPDRTRQEMPFQRNCFKTVSPASKKLCSRFQPEGARKVSSAPMVTSRTAQARRCSGLSL